MAKRQLPSPEVLRQLLDYNPETGTFIWKARDGSTFHRQKDVLTWNAKHAGREAFAIKSYNGYLSGVVLDNRLYTHRVAWAIAYGRWPEKQIDHINGDRADNRLENLREASPHENGQNMGVRSNNMSGVTGVNWWGARRRWVAKIMVNRKSVYIGLFEQKEDAIAAHRDAKRRLHTFSPEVRP